MKKLIIFCLILSVLLCAGFTYQPRTIQDTAHQIAELARSMGLPEDDPIIVRAKEIWWTQEARFVADRDILATVVYNEAGYNCTDRHMELVAAVVCNRVASDAWPDTVYEVVVQPGQYLPAYADPNSYYGRLARESDVWAKCQEIATRALLGKIECDPGVVYQAEFYQGSGVYETHSTSYSTTYFCYG